MTRTRTKSEFSAGGVVYRSTPAGYEIVAVHRARHTDWSLPKGHIEEGETREQAAIREVEEESGIQARIVQPLGEVTYFYRRRDGTLINKSVYHFLMEAVTQELGPPNREVQEARWVSIGEAHKLLTYQKDKEVVLEAEQLLGSSTY